MKRIKSLFNMFILSFVLLINIVPMCNLTFAQPNPYNEALGKTTKSTSLHSAIDGGDVVKSGKGSDLFNEQVYKIIDYVINIFIVIGIAIAFFGGYKIMMSDKEEAMKEGIRLVGFGALGIIIMVSAKFLATSLVGESGIGGIIGDQFVNPGERGPSGIEFADELYNKIMYPFIKVILYFVVGALFFVMAGKVVGFVTATDDAAKKKAGGIIIWSVVGILIVMGAKQIVEAVMGNQNMVLNKDATWISGGEAGGMGGRLLEFSSIPIIAQVINRVMGLTMFAILVLIIIQGYKIFTKPDDPKTREGLKKAILYMIIGVLVIGAAYVISNVLVINNVPIESAS